jgi:hypothetical protein
MLKRRYYEEALSDFFEFRETAENALLESTFGEKRYLELYPDEERGYKAMWTLFTRSEIEDFRKTGVYSTYPERFFLEISTLDSEDYERSYQGVNLWDLGSWNRIHQEMEADLCKQYDERRKSHG